MLRVLFMTPVNHSVDDVDGRLVVALFTSTTVIEQPLYFSWKLGRFTVCE